MTRIAMISEHASPLGNLGGIDAGGQNVYVAHLARHLAALGHTVDVFTRRDDPALPPIVRLAPGARVIHVRAGPPAYVPKEDLLPHMDEFTGWMATYLQTAAPYDLVHANFWMSGLVAADLKQRLGLPFAITFHALGLVRRQHQGEADGFPLEREAIERRIVREADRVIAECPQDEQDLLTLYDADAERLAVVPCGFDADEFAPSDPTPARERLGFAPDERIVLQLGRMVPRKGVDNAIRGFARLGREHSIPARLVLVGGSPSDPDPRIAAEATRLAAIAADEGVEEMVTFAGRQGREALRDFYSAADIFVTTPWYEPFGITPLEAMACGTPVVGSNVGGIRSTVVDGLTGYLVPPNDPDALGDRLAALFRAPARLRQFSRNAVTHVNTHYRWERVAGEVSNVFETIATPPASSTPFAEAVDGLIGTLQESRDVLPTHVSHAVNVIASALETGHKVLVCGNGGSAADSQHLAAELVGRFRIDGRRALPAIALTTDGVVLTAWANDASFEDVFARQIEALGNPGDVLIAFSTSGRSPNVVRALRAARQRGLTTVALLGRGGSDAACLANVAISVPSSDTQRTQEVHGLLIHTLAALIEARLSAAPAPRIPLEPLPIPPAAPSEVVAFSGNRRRKGARHVSSAR